MDEPGQKYEWFRDWFNSPYYHLLYFHRDEQEAHKFLDALVKELKPDASDHLLDLACGTGRHSIYLNSLGFRVTGLDLSSRNIEEARLSENERLSFFRHDMREPLDGEYSHIFNLFTSFGYFPTRREHVLTLSNIYNGLKPGGIFVLDYLNAPFVIDNLIAHNRTQIDGVQFDMIRRLNGMFIEKDIQITDGEVTQFYQEKVRAFDEAELRDLLTEAGFQIEEIWGDYELRPYVAESSGRMILKCRK